MIRFLCVMLLGAIPFGLGLHALERRAQVREFRTTGRTIMDSQDVPPAVIQWVDQHQIYHMKIEYYPDADNPKMITTIMFNGDDEWKPIVVTK